MFILGTLGSPGGLGIKGAQIVKVERDRNWRVIKYSIEKSDGRTFWDWLGLIGVPATLAVLGIWFQSQEQERASQEAKEQRRLAGEENKEETLQRYFDRVSQLLIEKDLIGLSSSLSESKSIVKSSSAVIGARTQSALRSFSEDRDRKASVVLFLNETGILKTLKISFRGADLSGVNLSGVNLNGAFLGRANLRDADLSRAFLIGAFLRDADLSGAFLSGTLLKEADLIGANFIRSNLSNAYLVGAFLGLADLSGANLSGANLRDADLSDAFLRDADLSGANLSGVRWTEETEWPNKEAFKNARNIPPELKKQLGLN